VAAEEFAALSSLPIFSEHFNFLEYFNPSVFSKQKQRLEALFWHFDSAVLV
jgi:hypothetical protein